MTYTQIILLAAKKIGVSGSLLLAVCTQESGLKNIVVPQDGGSPSYGICQVKEDTAIMLGFKGDGVLLMNPKTNAKYAAIYLKKQLSRYDDNDEKAVAAYNAGRYNESMILRGRPRNLKYVKRVLRLRDQFLATFVAERK